MSAQKMILIAEDSAVNRKILVHLLASPEYTFLEAENGQKALTLLQQHSTEIAAILLDLSMPVLDGFGFLRAIYGQEAYANIPIIVATANGGDDSEVDALKLGAWDFVTKPYNGEILKFRLRNVIDRSQRSAYEQLKYLAEYDTLTGIYNKSKFFEMTRDMLDRNPTEHFAFLRLDIDRFQLINSFFGVEEGDKMLCYLAKHLEKAHFNDLYTYGRMEADVFAVCFAYPTQKEVLRYLERSKEYIKAYNRSFDIVPIFGVYFLDDRTLPISEMLDRAALAAKTCKGNYVDTIGVYRPALRQNLEKEQEIINEMGPALEQHQFEIYLQPKYSLSTNLPSGAEALVRWCHPQKGLISPGVFIPVFEKNGFISKLDYFVWETVCSLLHDFLAQGVSPSPISVNVSRVNLYNPNLSNLLEQLTKRYELPPNLLQLELTESTYMDNPQMMEQVVEQLHAAGFTVLMDDFGSGYSSLSVLKDVDVDVLKIDMRFFEETRVSGRGENIVASIIRMAKWLNLPVTAEGVETQEQVDFLRGVGCDYVQGYYFAKPMPVSAYLQLLQEKQTGNPVSPYVERYAGLNPDRLWSLEPEMLLLFSDDPSPKAICEFHENELEMLRVNRAFKDLFGFGSAASDTSPLNFVVPEHHKRVLDACRTCTVQQSTASCVYRRQNADGRVLWLRLTLQYMQRVGTKYIILAHMENITDLKLLEQKYTGSSQTDSGTRFDLKHVFTMPEIKTLLAFLGQIFDVSRLVDPFQTAIVSLPDSGGLELLPYTCFQVWQKGTRCENCTSICAMQKDCRMTKYEYIKNDIFYVVSNPVTVVDATGVSHRFALELVSHVSDHMTLTPPEGKSIGQLIEETQRKIYTDVLTGAYNRRYLSELLFLHHGQTSVSRNLGLVVMDLKGFKQINDRYGHDTGDLLLSATAKVLKETVRQCDSVVRYGGDEFVITLTDCTEDQVIRAIARMRRALETISYREGAECVRADFGYAYAAQFDRTYATVQNLIRIADAAMYREKHAKNLLP